MFASGLRGDNSRTKVPASSLLDARSLNPYYRAYRRGRRYDPGGIGFGNVRATSAETGFLAPCAARKKLEGRSRVICEDVQHKGAASKLCG